MRIWGGHCADPGICPDTRCTKALVRTFSLLVDRPENPRSAQQVRSLAKLTSLGVSGATKRRRAAVQIEKRADPGFVAGVLADTVPAMGESGYG